MIDPVSPLGFLTFFIPAYIANMAPVFVRKLNVLNYPLDGGAKFNGKPLLGKNKTVRGLLFGTFCGALAGLVISFTSFPYVWWWGAVIGFAALIGDAIKSFFKRQLGIRPGGTFIPFDQLDFMVTAFLVSSPLQTFPAKSVILGIAVIFIMNVLTQLIGGWTKLKADSL